MVRLKLAAAVALALLAMGCGESQSDPAASKSPAPTPFDTAAAKAKAASEAAKEASKPTPAPSEKPAPAPAVAAYTPPFPDRLDLFEPRKQLARNTQQTTGNNADSVVLLGFAKLDQPKALLAIDGIVKPLAGGEEAEGVRVISIDPPRAVLQRGRSRWTASIQ